jgi:hypothetical protein
MAGGGRSFKIVLFDLRGVSKVSSSVHIGNSHYNGLWYTVDPGKIIGLNETYDMNKVLISRPIQQVYDRI